MTGEWSEKKVSLMTAWVYVTMWVSMRNRARNVSILVTCRA